MRLSNRLLMGMVAGAEGWMSDPTRLNFGLATVATDELAVAYARPSV